MSVSVAAIRILSDLTGLSALFAVLFGNIYNGTVTDRVLCPLCTGVLFFQRTVALVLGHLRDRVWPERVKVADGTESPRRV